MKRLFKRLRELRHRLRNFSYLRRKGLSIRAAWKKADLNF